MERWARGAVEGEMVLAVIMPAAAAAAAEVVVVVVVVVKVVLLLIVVVVVVVVLVVLVITTLLLEVGRGVIQTPAPQQNSGAEATHRDKRARDEGG